VHEAVSPEATVAGLQLSEEIVSGASTVRDAAFDDPLSVAVTVAVLSLDTVPAVAMNVVVLDPAATCTAAGTLTAA
jgi:hypothetical protein